MTETTRNTTPAVPKLRLPGDLDGLRRRRRSTGAVLTQPPPPEVVEPAEPEVTRQRSEPGDIIPDMPETEVLGRTAVGGLAGLPAWAKSKRAAIAHELRPENLAKIFEPMKPIEGHPLLYRSGWLEVAVLVSISLVVVALVLFVALVVMA